MQAPLMRSVNGIGLLNLISENGPISRASLAKLSNLSKPTVSSQVEALIQQGWVVEAGSGEAGAKGGKIPTLLKFNADAGRLFAVEINPEQLRIATADLEGNILDRIARPLGPELSPKRVLSVLKTELRRLMTRPPTEGLHRVISVAAPGRVDIQTGTVLEAGNLFHWHDVPLRSAIEEFAAAPVFVDNNVNLAALGEWHHCFASETADLVVVRLDTGIGAGVVLRGELHHGVRWAAGEIAHMILDLDEAEGEWAERGYLESVLGEDRIAAQALAAGHSEGALSFLRATNLSAPARRLRAKIVRHLGLAIAHLICAYDPGVVVLEGELPEPVFEEVVQVVGRVVPWNTNVRLSTISQDAVLLGTLVSARAHAYEQIARLINTQPATAKDQPSFAGIEV